MRKVRTLGEYYKPPKENFNGFLQQCKYAIDKIFGYHIKTDEDFWSTKINEKTYWQILKETGSLAINEIWYENRKEKEGLAIDFDFGRIVYAEHWKRLKEV